MVERTMKIMSNSKLASYKKLSPNNSGKRTEKITRITPHCVVGQLDVVTLGNIFAKTSTQASSNYGIGRDGRIAVYVNESNRSWCSSNRDNDQRAVTIECASDSKSPYAFNSAVYNALIDLCVDICKRNGKDVLLWFGDREKTLKYKPKKNEMVLTVHRWFANKSCPGAWMYNRMDDLAERVNKKLKPEKIYRVVIGEYTSEKTARGMVSMLKKKGFKGGIVVKTGNKYHVHMGAYKKKGNAEKVVDDLSKSGFVAKIV